MNDTTPSPDSGDQTVPARSMPPVSSGTYGHGSHLLQSGMMLPPQAPGVLGVIGKYQVIKILGEGGMGQVVLAREPVTDSLVAIKLIKAEFLHKQWAVHRFLTEARHMFRMSHGSILRVLDVSDRPEGPYFVMPYMPGGSLADKIKPGEPLAPEVILPVARAVAEALHHAHTRGITHRDLKPSNILLDAEDRAYLADFGLLRTFFNDSIVDASQPQMEGTVPYMSPAVAAGKAEDTRCDIYGFGCLLYEMLTGQPPYQGPSVDAVLKQIQDGPPPPIRQLNPHAPAHLTAIAEHAMARELRDRYASMGDVVADLDHVAHGKSPLGPRDHVGGSHLGLKSVGFFGMVATLVLVAVGVSHLRNSRFATTEATPFSAPKPSHSSEFSAATTEPPGTNRNSRSSIPTAIAPFDSAQARQHQEVWAEHLGVPVEITNSVAMKFVLIPPGEFNMGSSADAVAFETEEGRRTRPKVHNFYFDRVLTETPQRTVRITKPFYIGVCEVTQAEYQAVTGSNPSAFSATGSRKGLTSPDTSNYPVENVSWDEAKQFLDKMSNLTAESSSRRSYRLPTEAEWEYACRAGTITRWWFGDDTASLPLCAWFKDNAGGTTHPVGQVRPNPWGLFDMPGNVFEWCSDRCNEGTYEPSEWTDPQGPVDGRFYITRGGSYDRYSLSTRSAYRGVAGGSPWPIRGEFIGFRALCEVVTASQPATADSRATPAQVPFIHTFNNGTVTITKYTGDAPSIRIPDKINGLPVTGIAQGAFHDSNPATKIEIPASVTSITWNPFTSEGTRGLKLDSISVDPANPAFSTSPDGVLFNKDKTRLIACPSGRIGAYEVPGAVAEIAPHAFAGCSRLTSITLPPGVTEIADYSFGGCAELVSLAIPSSVVTMGANPFVNCASLASIRVEAGNTTFASAEGLVIDRKQNRVVCCLATTAGACTIPDGIISIGENAFYECGKLKSVTFPASLKQIQPCAFINCVGLTVVSVPEGVTEIPWQAFYGCTGLTRATLPASVTNIGKFAFYGCTNLTEALFLGNQPAVEEKSEIFGGADKVKVYCIEGFTGWGKEFAGRPVAVLPPPPSREPVPEALPATPNPDFDYAKDNGAVTITKYNGAGGEVTVPQTIEGLPVKSIGFCAFAGTAVTRVTIPEGLESLDYSFWGCPQLAEVILPNSLKAICGSAFQSPVLRQVRIPRNVSRVDGLAFSYSDGLTSIEVDSENPNFSIRDGVLFSKDGTKLMAFPGGKQGTYVVPSGVRSIGWQAFRACARLTEVRLPEGLVTIEDGAFADSGISAISIPKSVTEIGPSVFVACSQLESFKVDPGNTTFTAMDGVLFNKDKTRLLAYPCGRAGDYSIPDGVATIAQFSFNRCARVRDVVLPITVTTLEQSAFSCCGVETFTIPKDLVKIGSGAVAGCPNLTGFKVDPANPALSASDDGVLFNKERTSLICYPAGKPGSYEVPVGVTTIGNLAFCRCSMLTTVALPESVNRIEREAFLECGDLTGVHFRGNAPWLDKDVFTRAGKATVYHNVESLGWDAEFGGRPTAVWDPKTPPQQVPALPIAPAPNPVPVPAATPQPGMPPSLTPAGPFTYTTANGSVTITKFTGQGANVVIPDQINGQSVTMIGEEAFFGNPGLAELTIPATVTSLADAAFGNCPKLACVRFMGDAPTISKETFQDSNNATIHYLPETKGWGKEFGGRPTAVWDPRATKPAAATPAPGLPMPGKEPQAVPAAAPAEPGSPVPATR